MEKGLKRVVDLDIIELIEKPTDWVNLRIWIDARPLNNTLRPEHFHLPTGKEIFSQMFSAWFFSKLDASSGYWQIKVVEECSHHQAFGTPLGCYRFKRLHFGIHSTSEVFQLDITSIISDVPGSANSQDDIIAWCRTLAEHNEPLSKVFLKIRKTKVK